MSDRGHLPGFTPHWRRRRVMAPRKCGPTPTARIHCQRVLVIDVRRLRRVCSRAVQWDTIGKRTADQHGMRAHACDHSVQMADHPCLVQGRIGRRAHGQLRRPSQPDPPGAPASAWTTGKAQASALRWISLLNGRGNEAVSRPKSDHVPRAKLARKRHRRTPCHCGCSMRPQWQSWYYEEKIQLMLHIGMCIGRLR
jgi:hypothetical protein